MQSILDRLFHGTTEEAAPEEAPKPRGVKTQGPQKLRYTTVGQQRRAGVRAKKAQARKATARYRKNWQTTSQNLASLRGQLQVATHQVPSSDALYENAVGALVENYGSLENAEKVYDDALKARAGA